MKIEDWGLIDYGQALTRQMEKVKAVQEGLAGNCAIFCSHPPIVTMGRKTEEKDMVSNDGTSWDGQTLEIQRGGRATYHGPSQQVVYPIVSLLEKRDIHGYLRWLESLVIDVLSDYGVQGENIPSEEFIKNNPADEYTGVWVQQDKKIASVGIGVKKWVAFHGLAINLEKDDQAFKGMNPCGFLASDMISLQEVLGKSVDRQEFKKGMIKVLLRNSFFT